MTTAPRHVIFGTGAIGLATLDALLRRGETVRMVNRSGSAPVPDEVEVVGGDAADPEFTIDVTRGAQVVYQTLNPPYSRWVEEFPALQAGVLAAAASPRGPAGQHGERLHVRPPGRPAADRDPRLRRAHQERASSAPGWPRELLAAHQAGRVAGRHRTRLGLLRPARRRPVQPRRPALPRRPGRQDRQRPRRPRPAAHLHLHPRHRRRPRRPRRTSRRARAGVAPAQRPDTRTTRQLVDLVFQQAGAARAGSARYRPCSCASPR